MNKKNLLFLLPAFAMIMAGCNGGNKDTGGNDGTGGDGQHEDDGGGEGGGPTANITDVLTPTSIFGEEPPISYTEFNEVTLESGVKYYGKSLQNGFEWSPALQLNGKSGWIMTKYSNRKIESIDVDFQPAPEGKTQSPTVSIYGQELSFTSNDTTGLTPIATFTVDDAEPKTIEGDYNNILIYTSSAAYFEKISIEWDGNAQPDSVKKLEVTETEKTIGIGESKAYQLETVFDGCGNLGGLNWSSNHPEIATVDANGKVTGVAVGDATITVTSALDPTKTASCAITVSNAKVSMKVYDLNCSDPNCQSSANSYTATNNTVTYDDVTWEILGNGQQHPWRFGGKGSSAVDRHIFNKGALSETLDVDTVKIEIGTIDESITFNSIRLDAYSTAALCAAGGEGDLGRVSTTGAVAASAVTTLTKTSQTSWVGAFFRLTFNVTLSNTGSNKYFQVCDVQFWGLN